MISYKGIIMDHFTNHYLVVGATSAIQIHNHSKISKAAIDLNPFLRFKFSNK